MPEELKNIPGHGESREGRRLDYLSNKNSPRMQDFTVLVISDFKPQTFLRTMPLEYENKASNVKFCSQLSNVRGRC